MNTAALDGAAPTRLARPAQWRNVCGGLLLLLAWDASGWDLTLARHFGSLRGFAARDSWWASTLLHDGGRLLGWALLALVALAALREGDAARRVERWRWLVVTVLCLLLVPALKTISHTSCPWSLAEFGGVARYVSHWQWGGDDGPGHCFPSGHAVTAFAFLTQYFQWRHTDAARARCWLMAVLGAGLLFGLAQLARGAHYPSHTLWSAWLCWACCAAADALRAALDAGDRHAAREVDARPVEGLSQG